MNIVFAGTGAFGIPALRLLCAEGLTPKLVISQPDRPAGRKRTLTAPPLAAAATELGLPLFQPEKINRIAPRARIAEESPDFLVVIAYGQILRPKLLALPKLGCVNVHGSLLPLHRGASPVEAAILAGDEETGVTVMLMDEGLDSGPMLKRASMPLPNDLRADALHDQLAAMGAPLLIECLRGLKESSIVPQDQDHDQATHCGLIKKSDGALDWTLPAVELDRRVRAYHPWPGAYTEIAVRNRQLRVVVEASSALPSATSDVVPGTLVEAQARGINVQTGDGVLSLQLLKPAGKKTQTAEEFLRGYPLVPGDSFSAP